MLPWHHATILSCYYATALLVYPNAAQQRLFVIQVPTALVTSHTVKQGWEKMTQGWEKAKISHKFSTPSWKATILAKWSRPSANRCTTFDANTNTAWTNTILSQCSQFSCCKFSTTGVKHPDIACLTSQQMIVIWCNLSLNTNTNIANIDQYNTLTVPSILLQQVLHLSKTSRHCLCDFSTDDCDLMHFVSSKFPTFDLQRRFRASSMLQDWETAGKIKKLWIWYLKT